MQPVIFRTFKPEEAAQAHALMESNQHIGKLLRCGDPNKNNPAFSNSHV